MNLLNKKLLKNEIVRKRLRGANFYIKNVNIYRNINYILCIPVNGFTSDNIQLIRDGLLKYGYKVDKFTTNSFLSFFKYNKIILEKSIMPTFYIGNMLVVIIEKEKENEKKKEHFILDFLCKYILLKNLNYCNLIYFSDSKLFNNFQQKRTLVIYSLSKEKNNTLSIQLDNYKTKNIAFSNVQNVICNFIIVLLKYRLLILNLLTSYRNIKLKNN